MATYMRLSALLVDQSLVQSAFSHSKRCFLVSKGWRSKRQMMRYVRRVARSHQLGKLRLLRASERLSV